MKKVKENIYPESPALNYKKLLKYLIKKGKKNTLEILFRKGIIFWIKDIQNKDFNEVLMNAFLNTIPFINVKTKRKGSRNIYIPMKISEKKGDFLASNWILTNAFAKKKRNFYEGIVEELIECSLKKSPSLKKREDLYKLAEDNLGNLKYARSKRR